MFSQLPGALFCADADSSYAILLLRFSIVLSLSTESSCTHIQYLAVLSGTGSSCICPVKNTITLGVTVECHHLGQ